MHQKYFFLHKCLSQVWKFGVIDLERTQKMNARTHACTHLVHTVKPIKLREINFYMQYGLLAIVLIISHIDTIKTNLRKLEDMLFAI